MKNIYHQLLPVAFLLFVVSTVWSQSSPNCATASDDNYLTGKAFFNYGSASNAFNTKHRANITVGQPVIGSYFGQTHKGAFGFWASFLLPPKAPYVVASEGDLEDRVQVDWSPDPLSPASTGYKIYRNGSLLASVDGQTFSFLDFNVIAGKFYTYEVSGVSSFGEGSKGASLGFLNPNGVVTGQVKSFSNNPVPGAVVTLTPTLGAALDFDGTDDMAFAEYLPAYPRNEFTVSCWVKIEDGNDGAGIFDLGSSIGKNWWLHTLPAASGKGVRFGIGRNPGDVTELDYAFPATTASDWHFVAATYNGSSLLLYVNGELITTAVGDIEEGDIQLYLGRNGAGTQFYNGKLDEVRFFSRQLSQTELQMFQNRSVPANMNGLVSNWKFDENVGIKAFDQAAAKQKVYFCGATWTTDKPNVVNAGVTDETGFYEIAGVNYGAGQTFTAIPSKNFYFNQSLEFNGANSSYADLTNFPLHDSASVTLTVKAFDFSGNQAILSKADAGGNNQFLLSLNNGNLELAIGNENYTIGSLGMGFHHLAINFEKTGGSLAANFFIDGSAIGSHMFSAISDWSGLPWKLGAKANGATGHSNFFTGLIDEAAFFDVFLPLPDIQTFASTGTNVAHPNLANYFNLNEGSGTKLHDMGTGLSGLGEVIDATWSTAAANENVLAHEFTPSSRLATLNPSNTSVDQIDFTDQSTIPVSGYVRYEGTSCFVKKVEILVNGASHSPQIFTDADGYFSADFEPGSDVTLTPKFESHNFYPAFWELEDLSAPVAGILFRNQTKRKITGQLAGGYCKKSVIPNGAIVKVKVATLNGCFEKVLELPEGDGKFTFSNLPPDSVTVSVIEHSNSVIYNYFQNKGGVELDLKLENDTVDFIYFAPPEMELTALDTNDCGDPMLNMLTDYEVTIKVFETYDGGQCYLDTAALTFNNNIADLEQFDTLMTEGSFKHKFQAGGPNIVPPFAKNLQVTAEAHGELTTQSLSAVVLGRQARETTFASTSPDLPTLILRDPPGDASSAFMEEGTTTCQTWSFEAESTTGSNADVTLSLGPDFSANVGFAYEITLDVDATADYGLAYSASVSNLVSNEMETCVTVTKTISTSDNDLIVGSAMGGDLYMGGAMNLLFGITDELLWDTASCDFVLDKGLVVFPEKFSTTFIYSEYNIQNVVIPNLLNIGDTESANRWQAIIDRNTQLKNSAVFVENISFDAGVVYEQSETTEVSKSVTNSWTQEFSTEFSEEFGLTVNGVGLVAGLGMSWETSKSSSTTSTTTTSKTVGFTLSDDDIGDNFTVNIKKDKAYGTPVFELVSGQSQCPHEPNTLRRMGVDFSADSNVAVNVPMNDAATFRLTMGNLSQSEETRTYTLDFWQETNPDGAIVRFNGNAPPVGLEVNYGESVEVLVTVERGPIAFDYEGLTVVYLVDCEDERADALGIDPADHFLKALEFDVHFLEPCSEVEVAFPLQDWVLTPAMGGTMNITIDTYDKADPDLELVRVQYRRTQGDGAWINIAEIPTASLGAVFTIVPWLTSTLQDGLYEIRAVTQCFSGALNPGISHVIKGKIERTPPEVFGTPQPSDGVLSKGDEISITFTEPIRCELLIQADQFNNNNVGLYDTQTGDLIDATVTCSGDKILLVPKVPNHFIENRVLRVEIDNVEDLAGNVFTHAQWEFFVDRNPLRWQGSEIEAFKYEDQFKTIYKAIVNTGGNSEYYDITGVPAWMEVYPKNGLLGPGEQQAITFEFDSSMVIGAFADTIFMEGAQGDEPLPIDFRNLCRPPQWQVNPATYTYSMNFSVQLNIEGDVSTDKQDIVGAFINGELRGRAYLQYVPAFDKYEAFLTVYSDNFIDNTVSFQIWDASECQLYGEVLETFDYVSDELYGTPNAPVVLHTNNLLLSEIPLHGGWNWISFNLQFPDPSLEASLSSLNHPDNALIKSQTAFANYYDAPINGWLGSLSEVNNTSMFQYRSDVADTITMLGAPIDLASTQIPLAAGWNWIGYLPQNPLTVDEALSSLLPLNGDVIKSQTAFAQYVAGYGWLGNLQYMQAPKGYLLKLANGGTLTYPNNFGPGHPLENRNGGGTARSPWAVNPAAFEHTMILVGMLAKNGLNDTSEGMTLGAFAGDEIRGIAPAIYVEPLDEWMFFLTVYANQSGEPLTFKLYDEVTDEIADLQESMYFAIDGQAGTVEAPTPFSLDGVLGSSIAMDTEGGLLVQPNPFGQYTIIRFKAPAAGEAIITMADTMGRVVKQSSLDAMSGWNQLTWDVPGFAAGVYVIKVETNDVSMVCKVVVR